jgi:hypothetical protein
MMPDVMVEVDGHSRKLDLPRHINREDISRAQRDCEILSEILEDKAHEVRSLLNDLLEGNTAGAKEKAKELGLSEDNFVGKGGGLAWLLVVVVVLYATDAW